MWHPDTPHSYRNTVTIGDARHLVSAMPPMSVDLVFTDPIYRATHMYAAVARWAIKLLRPKGAVLTWCSKPNMSNCRAAMEVEGLQFVWQLDYVVQAKSYPMRFYGIFCWTTPCLWMQRPGSPSHTYRWIPDTKVSTAAPDGDHEWNKNLEVLREWVEAFSPPGGVVFDPFAGTSPIGVVCKQLGRRYIGFEWEESSVWAGRRRLAHTREIAHKQQVLDLVSETVEIGQQTLFDGPFTVWPGGDHDDYPRHPAG